MIETIVIPVTTTGNAGSGAGSATVKLANDGFLLGVNFDFDSTAPATTDTTLAVANPTTTLLTLTNTATDAYYAPRVQACGNTGTAISGVYELIPISESITVSVAQCNAITNAVVVHVKVLV